MAQFFLPFCSQKTIKGRLGPYAVSKTVLVPTSKGLSQDEVLAVGEATKDSNNG
jgi:hypothetical protein